MNTQTTEEFTQARADYQEVLKQFDATVHMFREHPTPGSHLIMAAWADKLETAYTRMGPECSWCGQHDCPERFTRFGCWNVNDEDDS